MLGRVYFLFALFFHTLQTVLIKKIPSISCFTLFDLLFLRNVFSFLSVNLIFVIFFCANKNFRTKIKNFLNLENKTKINIIAKAAVAFLPPAILTFLTSFLWHFGVKHVPLNNAILISYLGIIFVPFFSHKFFIKYNPKNSNAFWVIVVFFTLLITFPVIQGGAVNILSINRYYIVLVIDVILFSYLTCMRKQNTEKNHPLKIVYIVSLWTSLFSFFPSADICKKLQTALLSKEILLFFLTFIFYFLENTLRLFSIKISNIKYIEPVKLFRFLYSAILSYFILGESIQQKQIILICIIFMFNIFLFALERKEGSRKFSLDDKM